jgi:glutamate dehydrogenase
MPFLVDSVRMAINAMGFISHLIIHPVIACRRDADGHLTAILPRGESHPDALVESCMHLEINRETDEAALDRLRQAVGRTLADVRAAVDDWQPMMARTAETIAAARKAPPAALPADEVAEGIAMLEWMMRDRFTFLGCRDYDLVDADGRRELRPVPGSGLGIMRDDHDDGSAGSGDLPSPMDVRAPRSTFLTLTKGSRRATVHRPSYTDYVGVTRFDTAGQVVGERRFLGLYTSAAYSTSVREIPVLRRRVEAVVERSGVTPGSHKGKALLTILQTYPRDELFQTTEDELLRTATGILYLDERQRTRLFLRRDPFGRFVSALVFIPRDNHTTEVREGVQRVLMDALGGVSSEFSVSLSESVLARLLVVVHTKPGTAPAYDERALEAAIVRQVRRWEDDLADALVARFGEEIGTDLFARYGHAFPPGYRDDCRPATGVQDIEMVERLAPGDGLAVSLYAPGGGGEDSLRFRLIRRGHAVPLSDILPVLERMGVRVLDARPYEVEPRDAGVIWVYDTGLATSGVTVRLDGVRDAFEAAFVNVWRGAAESDDFNRLVLGAGLGWREIAVLRAFAKYARQTGFTFSQPYMEATLAAHPQIARLLVRLFLARHDPFDAAPPEGRGDALVAEIEGCLDQVPSLDEDRILRRFLAMVLAVTRTNYFQRTPEGQPKPYLALKFDPKRIPGLPEPRPMFEIYVYSPRVEGVHLRGGRIARGGLRWSDRMEDFRTEVLGLMKAQMVKNAVIVPVGAKGGFVVKMPPAGGTREALLKEVVECYQTFLRGLLDLTGSRTREAVVPPPDVVRHDDDDTYLVVAADKGTATFSDVANAVAAEYGFWMGDAFASGGSSGYDHKRMGITARGAWESVKKHFRTLGIDIQTTSFTVVGVGDMSGDVFGNGMLQSPHTRLIAAFDHRHIFLDPDPDPAVSFGERERMFALPRSSWADYDLSTISAGGGVFPRTAKSIPLSAQVRAALAVEAQALTPAELMSAILKAPVDMLYNGGIGTYVKATDETHAEVGDRSNDGVRVDASELRCRVIGEGGNLGLTQAGRIEFALAGGRIYTDAIDNSAGVDCSDHEVNIKILLDAVVAEGRLSVADRNALLEEMTDEVGTLVLQDNYRQAQALAIGSVRNLAVFDLQARFMRHLERRGALNRLVEGLPSDDELAERKTAGVGLAAPERAILMAYAKLWLFEQLVESDLPEDPFVASALVQYFPAVLGERYRVEMARHPLRREIVATYVCNGLVNKVGTTFAHRLMDETGATPAAVTRAFLVARTVFDLDAVWGRIEALDNVVDDATQSAMHVKLIKLIERVTRWFLRRRVDSSEIDAVIARFSKSVTTVTGTLQASLGEEDRRRFDQAADELMAVGVPDDLARYVAGADHLYAALDISDVAVAADRTIPCVTGIYFQLADRLNAPWLRERISMLPTDTHWQTMARAALRNELAERLRQLTKAVLALTPRTCDVPKLMTAWEHAHEGGLARMRHVQSELQTASSPDLAMLSVGVRELRNLA